MVLLYDQHFSEDDLKVALAFYDSPAGKRLAEKAPLLFMEGMRLGQQWGTEIGRRAGEKAVLKGRELGYRL
jgi:hypothetical protein